MATFIAVEAASQLSEIRESDWYILLILAK